ncbi:hypothetical protein LAZ67_9000809 [Cordylochernes scorpioides]|uniref:Uncharacterized protein n=1 Tax=Cordylochernes scorpioides TaxID=51811 RepID=A0ABY6KWC5_9ARAC|nr:hypothetical protein LAZ67_9000809 [Cordylochernes scorpioides]
MVNASIKILKSSSNYTTAHGINIWWWFISRRFTPIEPLVARELADTCSRCMVTSLFGTGRIVFFMVALASRSRDPGQ